MHRSSVDRCRYRDVAIGAKNVAVNYRVQLKFVKDCGLEPCVYPAFELELEISISWQLINLTESQSVKLKLSNLFLSKVQINFALKNV